MDFAEKLFFNRIPGKYHGAFMNFASLTNRIVILAAVLYFAAVPVDAGDFSSSGIFSQEASLVQPLDGNMFYSGRTDLYFKIHSSRSQHTAIRAELVASALSGAYSGSEILVNRLFLKYSDGLHKITAGRMRIHWGPGYLFRPSDPFAGADLLNISGPLPGVDALRIVTFPRPSDSIDFAWMPVAVSKQYLPSGTMALRTTFQRRGISFITGIERLGDNDVTRIHGSMQSETRSMGWRLEYLYDHAGPASTVPSGPRFTGSVDTSNGQGISLILEGFINPDGITRNYPAPGTSVGSLYPFFGKTYLSMLLSAGQMDHVSTIYALFNETDGSGMIGIDFLLEVDSSIQAGITAGVTFGPDGSEMSPSRTGNRGIYIFKLRAYI